MNMEVLSDDKYMKICNSSKDSATVGEHKGELTNSDVFYDAKKKMANIAKNMNKDLLRHDRRVEYSVHEKTQEIIVRVINTKTECLIREIPYEIILEYIADIREKVGIDLDERR